MTQGSVAGHLVRFAVPLLLGNLFQQLYNTVDLWVVGRYVSNEAYSAVGTVTPVIIMLIGFFMGLASGAGVVISQYYGAKKFDEVRKTVHTSLVMTLVLGVLLSIVGILIIPLMLRLMKTDLQAVPEATTYLTIYYAGVLGLMVYNMGSGILRAVGDSKRPFYFLVVSALMNIALDLLFVIVFQMGVAGVAYATILSQGVSAVLILLVLTRSEACIQLRLRELRITPHILRQIVRIGIPSALQMAITSFSNVFVQSYINSFGLDCMSGWTTYTKIDQFMLLPVQSLGLAATTFVGQNLGTGQVDRARQGTRAAFGLSLGITVAVASTAVLTAPWLVAFFNSRQEVVAYGTLFLRYMCPCYVLICVNQVYSGALRGAGISQAPTYIMLFSFVFFRQIYLYVVSRFISNTILPIAMGYPAGWLMCSLLTLIYYSHVDLAGRRVVEDPSSMPDKT
ncbi:MAG: MATE family efflux transporter [Lawsonibacter sp.]|nr:MATE family efflux transporter [Lawsonibacter sp.]